ncbi:cysteine proteinase [Mollisia scopiformis]|uniref:Cysteine proteinase n=1 Tax=Mollisia scopiformis TaxID=149040 RepID=A0A194XNT1_MOLSC|nr:cysteine proteinase [Mollisia scopiformis]KUJ21769.1 cysteine proteinase [Mollisia scopiformis]
MRSLGMRGKRTGARVALSVSGGPKGVYAGWNHLVNLVMFEGRRYLVDVGFGGNGPTAPLELRDGNVMQWGSTGDEVRLLWKGIGEFESPEEKCWVLEHRREGGEWEEVYCFTEVEFTEADVGVMNWKTARDLRGSFFNHIIICMRTEMEGEDVVGTVVLRDGVVKRVVRGESQTIRVCKSEVDRWEALEEHFGIVLGVQERNGIKGMVTELKGKPEDE